jgi:aryl-alcohol dehydrogenase-like predicted oxidoreductase
MVGRNRLALGTVQFGLAYGVSRDGGRVPLEEARAIIALAARNGIDLIDTAAAYGESEEVLGDVAGEGSPFSIVTKTLPIRADAIDASAIERVEAAFHKSLQRLRRQSVDALLVHDARDILSPGGDELWKRLEKLRDQGLTKKLGVSAYDRSEIDAAVSRFPVRIVQAPASAFDQRLVIDGTFARLASQGVEVHARSLFLQGLLLMTAEAVDAKLPCAVSALSAALGFALRQPAIHRMVIGVHSTAHLAECLAALEEAPSLDYARFASNDRDVVDPRRWAN